MYEGKQLILFNFCCSNSFSFPLTPVVSDVALSDVFCRADALKLVYLFLSHVLCPTSGLPHYNTDSRDHQ